MKSPLFSETSEMIYQTTRRYISEDFNRHFKALLNLGMNYGNYFHGKDGVYYESALVH
jgi:hypothetical protein